MALTRVHDRMISGAPINVIDYGADPSGVADSTSAIQAAFDAAASSNELANVKGVVFPEGLYKVSSSITISSQNIYVTATGIARIQPTDLSASSTYTIFNLTGALGHATIENLTFYMFGSDCNGIGATQLWRQSTIENCQFVGGDTGIDLAVSGTDKWGVTIDKCRFNDCDYGVRWIVNGQTGQIRDCLFFNCTVQDLRVVAGGVGSQIIVEGCVFENAGTARGTAFYFDSIEEVTMIGCQAERLYYDSGATGVAADYQFFFGNSTAKFDSCRFWGGGWGSVAPGNSRQYGMWLDNSKVTFVSSRLYSFTEKAIHGINNSRLVCDLQSRLDYRIDGDLLITCSDEIGENYILNGAYEKFKAAGTGSLPFSWVLPGSGGATKTTSGLIGVHSIAAVTITDGNNYDTNSFMVEEKQNIGIRFFYKISNGPGGKCLVKDADTGSILYTVLGNDINLAGSTDNQGLLTDTFEIPSGTRRIYLQFVKNVGTTSMQIEEVAVYKIASIAKSGSVYSDNDSSFGFQGSFGPALPYKPTDIHMNTAAPIADTWTVGDRVVQRTPTVGQPKAWACTVSGTPGTWVSEGNL